MERINTLFQNYIKNMQKQAEVFDSIFAPKTREEWIHYSSNMFQTQRETYVKNNELFEELSEILSQPMTEELADCLFDNAIQFYLTDFTDYLWLQKIFKVLIPYYEKNSNLSPEKLLWIYTCNYYIKNEIELRQVNKDYEDFSDLDKVFSLKHLYSEISDSSTRMRFWTAYHNKIVNSFQIEGTSLLDIYNLYDEMIQFWNSKEVQLLDGNNQQFLNFIETTTSKTLSSIYYIFDETEELQTLFTQRVLDEYRKALGTVHSSYEIDVLLYAAYLVANYFEKKQSIDEIFDAFLDYFSYHAITYKDETIPTSAEIRLYTESVQVFSTIAHQGVSEHKIRKMMSIVTAQAEKQWKNIPSNYILYINQFLKLVCQLLAEYNCVASDAETCIQKLIINRYFFLNLHVHTVQELSVCILNNLLTNNPELLGKLSKLSKTRLENKIGQLALFHDIGKFDMYNTIFYHNRNYTEEEQKLINSHPEIGLQFISQFDSLKSYHDVVLLHHVDYADSLKRLGDYHCLDEKILIDIIHIADDIAYSTQQYHLEEKESCQKSLQEFINDDGTKYHPALLQLIKENEILYKEILAICQNSYISTMEGYVQQLESFSIHYSFQEYVQIFEESLPELEEKNDFETMFSMIDKLFVIASSNFSNRNMGIAYYMMTRVYYLQQEFNKCCSSALEAARYLENSDEYFYLSQTYNLLGVLMLFHGNRENAIVYFLKCIEFAKRYEGSELTIASAMNNVGGIFRETNNFERALDYYEKALSYIGDRRINKLIIYNNLLYCLFKLGQHEKTVSYYNEIQKLMEETGFSCFDIFVFLTIVSDYLGDKEACEQYMMAAQKELYELDDILLCMFEIDALFEFLSSKERYLELAEIIDKFINCYDCSKLDNKIYENLIMRRFICSHKTGDYESIKTLNSYLDTTTKSKQLRLIDTALHMEKAYSENIVLHRTNMEIEKNNHLLAEKMLKVTKENETKLSFVNAMSHEIRTPIHAILGLDEMILRESEDEETLQLATDIQSAGNMLIGIINDILDFSKLEAGELEISMKKYWLSDMLKETKNMLDSQTKSKHLTLNIHCDPDVPKGFYGDGFRLKQIILNAITIAMKKTEKGEISLSISHKKLDEENVELILSFSDTSDGIPKKKLEAVQKSIKEFETTKKLTEDESELGLAILLTVITQLNGHIEISSELNMGTKVNIRIPQFVTDWSGIGEAWNTKKSLLPEKSQALFTAPEANILVVDDNAVNLKVVCALLKRLKVKVTAVSSGKECLEKCESNKYHLIFMDHRMPELDGVETLHLLKETQGINFDTPVVALTANAVNGAVNYYKAEGFRELITKPVNFLELERKMKKILEEQSISLI